MRPPELTAAAYNDLAACEPGIGLPAAAARLGLSPSGLGKALERAAASQPRSGPPGWSPALTWYAMLLRADALFATPGRSREAARLRLSARRLAAGRPMRAGGWSS